MSRIIGGGGGLTLDEIKTGLQYPSTPIITKTDRNGATANAVAGIYNPCKTLLNEHRPVCTKEYHLVGKYLDGANNPDVWFPIKGAGTGAFVEYLDRELKLNSGSGMESASRCVIISASRCVIDQAKFPITGGFLEVTCEIASLNNGEGGSRYFIIGFKSAFSDSAGFERACFLFNGSQNKWSFAFNGGTSNLVNAPLGRELQAGDIVTVRLDRIEGSPNINIARFYVNGQKQYETVNIPIEGVYAGIGAFASSLTDVGCEIGISYFGVKYSPGSGGEAIQNIEVINEPEGTGEVINEPEGTGEVIDEPEVTGEVID